MLAGIVAAAGAATYVASAAGLGPVASGLAGSGDQAILACDTDALTIGYTTVGGDVTSATVGDVADPGCEGAELLLTLTDAGGASVASGGPVAIPTDGDTSPNSVPVSLSPQPAAELVAGYRIAIAGP